MANYRIKGHESFVIREGWLNKGLREVSKDPKVFAEKGGADVLGLGTNMVTSLRYWLRTAGLIVDKPGKGTFLTDVGKVIYENDPYFEDLFSLWIVHINIARNYAQATSWNIFFNNMNLAEFNREEMVVLMTRLLEEKTGETNLSSRSIKDDCSAILNMYSEAEDEKGKKYDPEDNASHIPFVALGLLASRDKHYEKKRPSVDSVSPYLILYMIADRLNSEKSIPIDDISSKNDMPGKILNLNRVIINDYLDKLANKGLITVNRTAGLDMVYSEKKYTAKEILGYYYGGIGR